MGKNQEEMWTNFEPRHEHTPTHTHTRNVHLLVSSFWSYKRIESAAMRARFRATCVYPLLATQVGCTCHHRLYHFKSPYNTSVCVCRSNLGQGSDAVHVIRVDAAKAQVVGQVGKSMQVLLWWWWWLLLLTVAMVLMILACPRHYTSYCEWMAMKQATNVKVV